MSIDINQNLKLLPLDNKNKSREPQQVKDYQYIPRPYKKIAKDMEKQFLNFMVHQMEKSIESSENNSSQKYYQSLLTSERTDAMAQKNQGLGLQKVILDQIYPKNLRNPIAHKRFLKQEDSKLIKRNNIKMKTL